MGRGLNVRLSPFFADAPSTSVYSAHARARRLRHFCRWPWALCSVRYGLATPTSAHGGGRGSPCPPAGVAGADEDTRTEIGNVNVCPRRRHKAPQAPCSIRAQNSCKKRTRGAHRPLRGVQGGQGSPGIARSDLTAATSTFLRAETPPHIRAQDPPWDVPQILQGNISSKRKSEICLSQGKLIQKKSEIFLAWWK